MYYELTFVFCVFLVSIDRANRQRARTKVVIPLFLEAGRWQCSVTARLARGGALI